MKNLLPLITAMLLLVSCGNDPYDTGDGRLSMMRADFAEATTDGSRAFVSMTTDDGERLSITPKYKTPWAADADTTYRVLAYYNKKNDSHADSNAEMLSLVQVFMPSVIDAASLEGGMKTDPVTFESAWLSRNRRYINLDLSVKTGRTEDDTARHSLAIVCSGTALSEDGTRQTTLTLYHDQGGVPEYYTSKLYISIPVEAIPGVRDGDEVRLSVNTYKGEKEVSILLRDTEY